MLKELSSIKKTVRHFPLVLAAIYILVSVLYIAFSDWLIARIFSDIETAMRVQTLKGLGFVVISAILLYVFVRIPLNRVYRTSLSLAREEEKERLILESMTDGVVVIDSHRCIIESNPALLKICGCANKNELLNRDIFTFFDARDHDRLQHDLETTLRSGNSGTQEYSINKIHGGSFSARVNAAILKDGEGGIAGIVAVIEDVTEYNRAQAQLQELYQKERAQRQELQEESRARGMFIDVLAHELRTPLTPIMISGDILAETLHGTDGSIMKKLVSNIVEGSATLSRRLEELLEIGRFSRGSFVLEQKRVDLSRYFNQVVQKFSPLLEKNQQKLKIKLGPALPCTRLDPERLEQVIKVLLSNASIFSPPQSEIFFSAVTDQSTLYVEVEDHGSGISGEELRRLFMPYHRTEQDRQKFPGIGLGMAVARQIIEAHGGKIEVKSEINKGSLFRFEIPLNGN